MSKSVVRSVKNVTKGYSSVQVKVRNATSNDAWGPTGADMADISQMTYNSSSDFYEVMDMLDKRLNDKGKNWRHVLKSLKVLDYCLHEGSELVVTWARKNIYIIKTLREFQYVDEDSRDVGINVRTSAKELTSLILDEERLRTERKDRKQWKSRVTGLDDFNPTSSVGFGSDPSPSNSRRQNKRMNREGGGDEDLEYKLALEASKNEADEERSRRAKEMGKSEDDPDLERALKLSKEEEELRRRQLEQNNAQSLFDDGTPAQVPQQTGYNQGYQQQGAVDWYGNPMEQQQQQPQSTGYLNNMYSQPTGMTYQQTGFQNGFTNNPYQQQQPTGFDQTPYGQQGQHMQPQQTSFNTNSNPYGQQNGFDLQQQQQFQPQQDQQQQQPLQTGSNNPWASQKQDSLAPQPTGSNNPFASSITPRPQTSSARAPTLNTLSEQKTATQFNTFSPSQNQQQTQQASPFSTYAAQQPQQQQPQQPQPQKEQNPQHAALNALLSSGEGQDTFGNTGNLRIPAQHTTPATFVNSAGGQLGRMQPMATGNNPFMGGQYTGMQGQQQQAQPQVPAQTGPGGFGGGGYGAGAGNPFGMQGQQGQRGQQGGSLIDL